MTVDVAELRALADFAATKLRDDNHATVWDAVTALPGLLDEVEALTADRDRWRREFLAAAKHVEECARLHAEVRRLERHNTGLREALGAQTAAANVDALRWLADADNAPGCACPGCLGSEPCHWESSP